MTADPAIRRLIRPRIVLVRRKTPLELLMQRHGTIGQVRFYLRSRGEELGPVEQIHARLADGLAEVIRAIPADQRRVEVDRDELDRFIFAPDDTIVVVGQDGLVPNVAKYLRGQMAVGINPDPEHYEGVLCRHAPNALPRILEWIEAPREGWFRTERRTMALAEREDGQSLLALNEVFVGHRSHQSARYRISAAAGEERQSSSGVICATGTGATGWTRSIVTQLGIQEPLPKPEERALAWFVREPWPSVYTGATITRGVMRAEDDVLELHSEMAEGGVVFADGIESDYVDFLNGHILRIRRAEQTLNLLVPAA